MNHPKAFLFDLNGTMINDMEFHLKVWYDTLHELGATLSWDDVRSHMYGKNDELLDRVFGKDKFSQAEKDRISMEKEVRYQKEYKPHLDLLPGLFSFLGEARKKSILMAIGSAAIPFNIDFVLDNLNIRHYFNTIVSAHDVAESKPNPEVYLKAARLLNIEPANCIVFEDAPKGVEAARNAGMKSVVITSMHTEEDFSTDDSILLFVKDYTDPRLLALW